LSRAPCNEGHGLGALTVKRFPSNAFSIRHALFLTKLPCPKNKFEACNPGFEIPFASLFSSTSSATQPNQWNLRVSFLEHRAKKAKFQPAMPASNTSWSFMYRWFIIIAIKQTKKLTTFFNSHFSLSCL
jgi:hypothetical protein